MSTCFDTRLLRTLPAMSAAVLLLVAASGCAGTSSSKATPTAANCVPPNLNVSAALAGSRVTVSPAPETRDASAQTQISFLGVPAAELSGVTVSGSRSGSHPGTLEPYSQGDGASFLPTRQFSEGELVTVSAVLTEGTQSTPFSWSFTVAVADTAHAAGAGTPIPPVKPGESQSFISRPDLEPPTVTVTAHSAAASPGDVFLAPYSGPGQYGPMILDGSGELVWFKALPGRTRAADFRVQSYEGKPVLTWWQDPLLIAGRRTAGIVIDNSSYQQIATVAAGNGYQADLHEFQITPRGTAYLTIYNAIQCNLSSVHGPKDGAIADTLVQEIDLKTGLVMYEWHSVDHVPLADSYSSAGPTSLTTPFDFFHINSIEPTPEGGLLIDSRDTWALYDVSAHTGQVIWTLGGKHSSFTMGAGTKTAFQHDARLQPNGEITFFDNGASPKIHAQSRAIEERLDMQNMTVELTRRYEHPTPLVAGSQGNMQALPDGDWMVGWGQVPDFSEFSPSGALLFDAHLPSGYESYRTYRFPWSGQPSTRPALVLRAGANRRLTGYVSWNGATGVASWRVLEGSSPSGLRPTTTVERRGFQSTIPIAGSPSYVAIQALDSHGALLGSTAVTRVPTRA
jgi:Arylsulfotransferase (ASST)